MIHSFKTEGQFNYDILLEKDKKFYCFIGENGSGKTKLIENMAKSLIYCSSIFKKRSDKIKYSGFFMDVAVNDQLKEKKLTLLENITINDHVVKDKKTDNWGVTPLGLILKDLPIICDKPIVFINPKGRGHIAKNKLNTITIRERGLAGLAEVLTKLYHSINLENSDTQSVEDWFAHRLLLDNKLVAEEDQRFMEVIELLKLIDILDPSLELYNQEKNQVKLLFNANARPSFIFNDTAIPFHFLSSGYASIIKIFQEIIDAYSAWTGAKESLLLTEGIVFIDEIDSHLHPKWQSRIVDVLKNAFPNTTFYITTHSPIILSSLENHEAYKLINDKEKKTIYTQPIVNPKEWYFADLLSLAFQVPYNIRKKNENENLTSLDQTLIDYTDTVKDYLATDDKTLLPQIMSMYEIIKMQLPETDSRLKNVEALKQYL